MSQAKLTSIALSGVALAILAACTNNTAQEDQSVTYYCGAQTVVVYSNSERIQLRIGDHEYPMRSSAAASGTRYASEDDVSDVTFWSRGHFAQLEIDGRSYPQCREAGALPERTVARGNEPFWTLTVGDQHMVLNRKGEEEVEYRIGEKNHSGSGTEVVDTSEQLRVTISEQLCQDSMSGMYFPQQAELEVDGEHLQGCAGESLSLLQGVEWRVQSLDDDDYTGHNVTVRFMHEGDMQVVGRAACNRYFGRYELTGESLTVGQLAGTKMACAEETMRVEYQFLQALREVHSFSAKRDENGTLRVTLMTNQGQLVLR